MSLSNFHLLFISISVILAVTVGVWGVFTFTRGGEAMPLVLGVVSLVAVPVLCTYGLRVRVKLREL